MTTYKERYLAGEIEFEEIDKYSYQWGMSAWLIATRKFSVDISYHYAIM